MPVNFDHLTRGKAYERPHLAQLWGYSGYQALSMGVVTPADTQYIILFVTEQKQESLTQYHDRLEGQLLHWEGEKQHASDRRIVAASSRGDEIHLFHRKIHHSPFIYLGKVVLEEHSFHQLMLRSDQLLARA